MWVPLWISNLNIFCIWFEFDLFNEQIWKHPHKAKTNIEIVATRLSDILLWHVNVTWCMTCCSTLHHVVYGLVCGFLAILSCGVQILENVDVWCKVNHVLFPTAIRHLDQWVQTTDGWTEDITFIEMETRKRKKICI